MDIRSLARQPQLTKITLDSPQIVERHGDAIEFYTWDRVSTPAFVKMASLGEHSDPAVVFSVMQEFILDSEGKPVLEEGVTLPMDILVAAMTAVSEGLGKS